jgi:hypothetical protein
MFYKDFTYKGYTWDDLMPLLPPIDTCDCCGIDSGELVGTGHQSFCYYYDRNQNSAPARSFIIERMIEAYSYLERENILPKK